MINKNELRIGNWFSYPNGYKPFQIDEDILQSKEFWEDMHSEGVLHRIPLTPQILKACGFESDTDDLGSVMTYYINGFVKIVYWKGAFLLNYYDTEIKYLHQLQNLYFDLTDKELQVDLKKLAYQK